MTRHAVIFSLDSYSCCSGGLDVGGGVLLPSFSLSLSSIALLPQLISSSGFSMEHLALSKSRGWGSVTFDEWIHLWLTPLLSDCLILTLSPSPFLSPSLICSVSEPLLLLLSGLCSSLKTVVADLIGLCWTLALCCISYDHRGDSLTWASSEVQPCNTVWTLLSVSAMSQVFPGTLCRWAYQLALNIFF